MARDKRLGRLVAFRVKEWLPSAEKTKFFRELHGHVEKSNFGQYSYKREGLLETVPHVSLARAAFIMKQKDANRVLKFLRKACTVTTREVVLTASDRKMLERSPKT